MREHRLLAVCGNVSAKLDHKFGASRMGALPLIVTIPSSRRSGLLLLLKLRKAPFPYLERSEMCAAGDRRKTLPLLDLHQTLLADVEDCYGLNSRLPRLLVQRPNVGRLREISPECLARGFFILVHTH